jgi:hypothetical protein
MRIEAIVTIPPDVVRTRASSTVFVKASSLWNRDLVAMMCYYSHSSFSLAQKNILAGELEGEDF